MSTPKLDGAIHDFGIRITVARQDGEVTHLRGVSGMAACMGPVSDDVVRSDPPTVSLRCSSHAELAWNLAALMGAVRYVAPEAYEAAFDLIGLCNFQEPQAERKLPTTERS